MKSLTIRHRILVSFAAVLVVMSVIAVIAYAWFLQTQQEATEVEKGILPDLSHSTEIMIGQMTAHSLLQEYALEDNPSDKRTLESAIASNRDQVQRRMDDYEAKIVSDVDKQNYAAVKELANQFRQTETAVLDASRAALSKGETPNERTAIKNTVEPVFLKLQSALQAMVEDHRGEANSATQRIGSIVRTAEVGLSAGLLIALGLALLLGYLLFRAITGPLTRLVDAVQLMRQGDFSDRIDLRRRDEFSVLADGFNAMADDLTTLIGQVQRSGIQVSTSITGIAATSKQQQATATEIAATTTEIRATAKEISATSNELVRTMNEVSTVAEQTAVVAGGGQAGLARMEETMHQVMEAAAAINSKLAILSEKAGSINQVVTTITKVADQTNLLSLNASIEAEKAGQYGRGFAVVATEIRRLADQTAVSTYDIEQMVKDIQSAVAAGVMGMDKFSEQVRRGMQEIQQVGGQLFEIIQQVQGLVPRFEVANEGMQAQATGAGQISDTLTQLSEAAQQTVESLQQSALAIDELNQVSGGLRGSISRFKLRA
ncbi:methyl-accepting chemotaxis protein [Mesorhizobium sp. WSM4307]|uniref:methyl-accepting chemotaxis protein n=1 Tax=unclassified Mesorhizobium TaxID=325217 RepID=UPI00115D71EB|nr:MULTISPECIES: methyl-accepting chemotaxis protein [unclassified Mesorhizobium]TRC73903.1 methyl-accepting chemotaxis protein [Mesorhizobium sp. WSM4310]TRC77892.1 methyl-accepting chemotaxis protein [Mesorhizobium sp. WSM4315]TRC78714.1 methyl-accepting chemotaxis protein [Mesorhizobium sp. WSM4307]